MSDVPEIPTPKSDANAQPAAPSPRRAMPGSPPPTVAPPMSIPEVGSPVISPSAEWRCARCGSTDLASAYLIDYADKFRQLHLAPRGLKLPKISRMLRPFRNMVKVNAQVCRNCGAVTLEVNPDDFEEAERKYGRR